MLLFLSLVGMSGCLVALMAVATSVRRFGQSRSRFRLQGFVRERFREYRRTAKLRESGRYLDATAQTVLVPVRAGRGASAETGRLGPILA